MNILDSILTSTFLVGSDEKGEFAVDVNTAFMYYLKDGEAIYSHTSSATPLILFHKNKDLPAWANSAVNARIKNFKWTVTETLATHEMATEGVKKPLRNPLTEGANIAQTILAQLGGNRFIAMTGAKDLGWADNYLRFKLPRGAKKGINYVKITLTGDDLYDVQFMKLLGVKTPVEVANHTGIYADQLKEIFTDETGLYTSL